MEVMDLSIRKPQTMPAYSPYQGPFTRHDHPLYTFPSPNMIPANIQPSIGHLGFFQQLQCPGVPPMVFPQNRPPTGCSPTLSPNSTLIHSPSSTTSEVLSDKDAGEIYKTPNQPPLKRPFKTVATNKPSSFSLVSALDPAFEAEYEEYRKNVLSRIYHDDVSGSNRNMKRSFTSDPEKCKDPEYLEKRRKNNEAAKRSREARKAKEDELAIRVAFLEKQNLKMKFQLAAIEREKKMILLRNGHIYKKSQA